MKRRGFTLIELLAVIVILAIIALIAVPTIINIIGNAQKSAFKNSAYGIIKAGELYYTNQMMEPEGMTEEKIFTFPNDITGLDFKGSKPVGGTLKVSKEGEVALAINNGRYCVKKGYYHEDVLIDENLEKCIIPGIITFAEGTNAEVIATDCIHDNNKTCAKGTKVSVRVNKKTTYDFYVMYDYNGRLTLIMDRNLGSKVAWITQEDYVKAGGIPEEYGTNGTNNKGPLSALKILKERTNDWKYIESYDLSVNIFDELGQSYGTLNITNTRARMLDVYEAGSNFNCSSSSHSCLNYLYENTGVTSNGYWISSPYSVDNGMGLAIDYDGKIYGMHVNNSNYYGVRPVITVSKSL